MKKFVITLMLLSTVFAATFAQGYDVVETGDEVEFNNDEVYLTAGLPSFLGLFSGMFVAIFEGLADANNGESNKKNDAAFSITGGYNHYFNENFALGGFASYEKFSSLNLVTVQAKVTAQYGWEHFKLYHALSGGVLVVPGSGSKNVSGVFDITYLGAKADFKDFSIFVEGSFPSTAIIKVGASYKF